jgi:hypothetical protein
VEACSLGSYLDGDISMCLQDKCVVVDGELCTKRMIYSWVPEVVGTHIILFIVLVVLEFALYFGKAGWRSRKKYLEKLKAERMSNY